MYEPKETQRRTRGGAVAVMRRSHRLLAIAATTSLLASTTTLASAAGPRVVTLDAPSPLIEIRVMLPSGSAHDPPGKEGLAYLTAHALLEGSFGDPAAPVTKDELARLTEPWGEGAAPDVRVDKEATTFGMVVPRDVLDTYLREVFHPLFTQPLFADDEIDRLVKETITEITGPLRYENLERLGLEAIDDYVYAGTARGHGVEGAVQSLSGLSREDIQRFYTTHYQPNRMILGISTGDPKVIEAVTEALAGTGRLGRHVHRLPVPSLKPPAAVQEREVTIVAVPNVSAAGLHLAFPLDLTRKDDDFWPLYVANVYFGTHRDNHGLLYQQIRAERGYNYGDYSYIEHFAGRPIHLFPPFNTPRTHQLFSIWIRPVGPEYAHHILKAMVWELENLVRNGVSEADVEASKKKAKVLYLNLAETSSRLLAARMDDAFYEMDPGYLDGYLDRIDAVTAEQVNAAVRKHLRFDSFKVIVAIDAAHAEELAAAVVADGPAPGKGPADYQLEWKEVDGRKVWEVPAERVDTLELDGAWTHTFLGLSPDAVRVVPVEALFETGDFITETAAAASR